MPETRKRLRTEQSQTPPFKIGDKVTCRFFREEGHLVRTVTEVRYAPTCGSGWLVSADAGGECDKCHRPLGRQTPRIDSTYFKGAPL